MMSSQCIVPKWNLRHEEAVAEEEEEERNTNRSPHVQMQSHHNLSYVVPMSCNNEVRELTWQNGQLGVHGVSNKLPQRWGGDGDHTLESIVHHATSHHQYSSTSNTSMGKWDEAAPPQMQQSCKRVRSESKAAPSFPVEESACASASATFCRDTDATMMTWNSFDSSRSLKTARIHADDDSLYHDCSENQDGEGAAKGESCRSQSSARRSRAAAIHNLSERRRRDRINEKMKALQKLVPNASKTDKASMLDEVIEYLKQLQAQVHMMSNARNMSQMMMPLGMQQHLQMSLLARMGMGMGGVLDVNNLTRNLPPSFPPLMHAAAAPLGSTTPFVPPPFTMTPVVPPPSPLKPNVDAATISTDAYNTFLAQSMNMEFLNKMSALYRQQSSSQQPSKKAVSLSLPNDAQGG